MAQQRQATPVWLDLTRLVSRTGRGVLTGIDRVERAWLRHLLAQGAPETRYLLRSTRGYLLLDHRGASRLSAILDGAAPGAADLLSRVAGKGSDMRHRVEASLRRLAVDRALPRGLPRLIARASGADLTYLNLGHSNLSHATLSAFASADRARVGVLIHDLIPITHPDLAATGMPARFAGRLDRVRACADLVLCNSAATMADLEAHWQHAPRRPPACVAHLGLDPLPRLAGPRGPSCFVMLGTIEPRKNHALMLEVWERLAADLPPERMPDLHIIGPVGWRVAPLMARIAAHPLLGRSIHLHGPLPEAEMQAHLTRAAALLFPSLAEGYGYPPLEAAMMGALPICSDLPVFRETLGNRAVYLSVTEAYPWADTIRKHVLGIETLPALPAPDVPGWPAHFERVARALRGIERKGHA